MLFPFLSPPLLVSRVSFLSTVPQCIVTYVVVAWWWRRRSQRAGPHHFAGRKGGYSHIWGQRHIVASVSGTTGYKSQHGGFGVAIFGSHFRGFVPLSPPCSRSRFRQFLASDLKRTFTMVIPANPATGQPRQVLVEARLNSTLEEVGLAGGFGNPELQVLWGNHQA